MAILIKGINPSKIILDKKRKLASSVATTKGFLIIGIKDNPSKADINATIRHEFAHTKISRRFKAFQELSHHDRSLSELEAYAFEKKITTPEEWNNILPTRIKDFIPFITWETEKEQAQTRRLADTILIAKKGGGNLGAIEKANTKLLRWWLEKPITIKPRVERVKARITPKRPRIR